MNGRQEFDEIEESTTVIKQVDATKVYINVEGELVIRQYSYSTEDDSIIAVPIDQATKISDAIWKLVSEAENHDPA